MSSCCASACDASPPRTAICPSNGIAYAAVSPKTVLHHLKQGWERAADTQGYYFCEDPNCEVVYFNQHGDVIQQTQVTSTRKPSDAAPETLLCYCFGITKADFSLNPATKDYVIEKTRLGLCACETSHPSGRCCLKNFPRS